MISMCALVKNNYIEMHYKEFSRKNSDLYMFLQTILLCMQIAPEFSVPILCMFVPTFSMYIRTH